MVSVTRYGQGKPILCLHGWAFNQSIWHSLKSHWPSDWQLISVDLPGHGNTPAGSMTQFCDALLAQLPEVFSIVAWSLGGLYAFELLSMAYERIAHLFAVATSPCFVRNTDWPGVDALLFRRFYRRFNRNPQQTLNSFIELQLPEQSLQALESFTPVLPKDAKTGLGLLETKDYRSLLYQRQEAVSFLLGKQDIIVPFAIGQILTKILKVEDVTVLSSCAHMPFLSNKPDFFQWIQERLA